MYTTNTKTFSQKENIIKERAKVTFLVVGKLLGSVQFVHFAWVTVSLAGAGPIVPFSIKVRDNNENHSLCII